MKQFILWMMGLGLAGALDAQVNTNDVTFVVNGNVDLVLVMDGVSVSNGTISGNRTTFMLNDLRIGQHNFQVTRTSLNNRRRERINSSFNLRIGFSMRIKVNPDGSLELTETRMRGGGITPIPMSNADFNIIYQNARSQRSTMARRNALTSAFNDRSHYFTSSQVSQLLQLIYSENSRLELAKLSYRSVTDRDNFYLINNLLASQASKDELSSYIDNYYEDYDYHEAMTDVQFNTLYQDIRQQWPQSAQVNAMNNAFTRPGNYFSTNQVRQLLLLINNEASRLQLAKVSYRAVADPSNFTQVYDLFTRQSNRDDLAAYVRDYDPDNNNDNNPSVAMSDADFNVLFRNIQQQWPQSTQVNSLTSAFNNTNNYFTSIQARQLISLVTGDMNRLPLAKLSYRSIVDRDNFSQVFNLLASQASRDELTNYVNNFNGGYNYGVAMPDAQFNDLYQSIQGKFFPNEKMSALTDLFTNTADHFTSAQVKQLIALVTFETNRLQLAKLSYRTVVDRNNFTVVYDLLGSQSSRNELDTYVRSYRD